MPVKVGVALGSNLGDRLRNMRKGRQAIAEVVGVIPGMVASSIYETEPVGCEAGAGKFLNAVLEFEYEGGPIDLWREFKQIEAELGRPSQHERNVSRTIDLDLLFFGDLRIATAELVLPHPRMHERRFVLEPLAEIDPDLVLPGQSKTVRELLASVAESATVTRLTNDWRH
jgi:2-amino-4-hydroxy-6-hydroxymethyldihydropteridine diphosphokinase